MKPLSHRRRARNKQLAQLAQRQAAEAAKPKPRKDAYAAMVKNTPLAMGGPLHDPLWMSIEQSDRRRSVMEQMAIYEESSLPAGFVNFKIVDNGRAYDADAYKAWQHRHAYDLLQRGVDVRTVAAQVHRDVPWVEAIRSEFQIP
jgi:hypothetical protein